MSLATLKQKRIGMIGGCSFISSSIYYKKINQKILKLSNNLFCPQIVDFSLNQMQIIDLLNQNKINEIQSIIMEGIQILKYSKCDFYILACNTLHCIDENMFNDIQLPLLHIVDSVGQNIQELQIQTVAILGSKLVMKYGIYQKILSDKFQINVTENNDNEINEINEIIFKELVFDKITKESHEKLILIINQHINKGAQAVVLACTELPIFIKQESVNIPIIDSLKSHINSIVRKLLN